MAEPRIEQCILRQANTSLAVSTVKAAGFQELEFNFVTDNPRSTLFHCHQQLHMDFGFMALFRSA